MAAPFFKKTISGLVLTACAGYAQAENAVETVELEEVVVTANKTARPISKVTASVEVVTREEIENMGAVTLKEVFNKIPGLIIQHGTFPSGSSVSKSSVNIRGIGATGSLWLVDGRRLAGEVNNPYDMDRIPASMIERVEIVKGPMSALYGADAMGGVINIITKQPKDGFSGEVSLSGGMNRHGDGGNKQISASVQGKAGAFSGSLYGSRVNSDPYHETETTATRLTANRLLPAQAARATGNDAVAGIHSAYDVPVSYRENARVDTFGGRGEVEATDKLKIGAEFNWFNEKRDGSYRGTFHPSNYRMANGNQIPAFDVPVNSYDKNRRLDFGLDAKYAINEDADAKLRIYRSSYTKRNDTTLRHYADFGYSSETASVTSGMNADVDVTGYELSGNWQAAERHLLTGGVEYRTEKRDATVFTQGNHFTTREVGYLAAYLQDDFSIGDTWAFTVGGRYDRHIRKAYTDSQDLYHGKRTENEATFRVGAVKKFNDKLSVRANIAQGYRVPDIREQFIQKQTAAGMQLGASTVDARYGKTEYDLQPEKSTSYELGVSGKNGRFNYAATAFYNDIEDRISQVTRTSTGSVAGSYYTFENISDARTYGGELELGYRLLPNLGGTVNWTELRTENRQTGQDLEFSPKRTVTAGLDWQLGERVNAGLQVKHVGRQKYLEGNTMQTAGSYTFVNVNAAYRFGRGKQAKLYGGIDNLFNTGVDKRLGSDVGTYYYAGLKYSF